MDQSTDKRFQIKEYFIAPKPKFPIKALLIGILLLVVSVVLMANDAAAVGGVGIVVALVITGVGILLYIKKKKRFDARPSDAQMDQWLAEDFQKIIDTDAINKLGIDASEMVADPLVIPGPIFWSISGFKSEEVLRRLGSDECFRYSIWDIQVFVFLENFLGSYGCKYNWLKNTSINESTNEFFYKDVVSVKTATASSSYTLIEEGKKLESAQMFQLKLSGDEVTVITNDSSLKVSSEMSSRSEKAVQVIRTMLRQKKA